MVDLDHVRESLNEQGFDFQTPDDMIDAAMLSVGYNKPQYGTASRGDESFSIGKVIEGGIDAARDGVAAVSEQKIEQSGKFWLSLNGVDAVSQFPNELKGKTIEALIQEVAEKLPGLTMETLGVTAKSSGAVVTQIDSANGKAYLFQKSGYVWVDTSEAGGIGTYGEENQEGRQKASMAAGVYQIAQAYAKNNGLKFAPDPAGLSKLATVRRWAQLLSSAIRFGDTSHIDGIDDVDGWKSKDSIHNTGLLALHEYYFVKHFFPEIESLQLSADLSKIVNDGGREIPRKTLRNLLTGERHPRTLGVGESTLRRAIVTGHTALGDDVLIRNQLPERTRSELRILGSGGGDSISGLSSSGSGDGFEHALKGVSYSIARADSPLLTAIDALQVAPEAKAEVYKKMAVKVREIRRRFEGKKSELDHENDRHAMLRDLATLEAVAKTLPPAIRGKIVGSFRKMEALRTVEGREAYMLRLLPKIEQALENHLQGQYCLAIRRQFDRGAIKVSESKTRGGKIGGVAHAIYEEARKAMKLLPEQADATADKLQDELENAATMTAERLEELDGRIAALSRSFMPGKLSWLN